MQITCPQCGFSKNVSQDKLHGAHIMATCPKCGCRFPVKGDNAKNIMENQKNGFAGDQEEDIRVTASRAYQKEAARFESHIYSEEKGGQNSGVPWQNAPGEAGWWGSFFQTCSRAMFSAPTFFRGLSPLSRLSRPLIFYVIIIFFQTIVERMWGAFFLSILAPGAASDPQLAKMLEMLSPENNMVLSILTKCAILILQLYLLSFILYLTYRLMRPKVATFSLLFQIMVYSSSPALLCVVPILGSIAGLFWSLGCLAIGCKTALRLDWAPTFVGFLPIIFLLAPLYLNVFKLLGI